MFEQLFNVNPPRRRTYPSYRRVTPTFNLDLSDLERVLSDFFSDDRFTTWEIKRKDDEPKRTNASKPIEKNKVSPTHTWIGIDPSGPVFKVAPNDDSHIVIKDEPKVETPKVEQPKSIFDMLDDGKKFEDFFQTPVVDDEIEEDDEEEYEDQELQPRKDPFVFIANRLTFVIKTKQPIIFDTSKITPLATDCIFVPFDEKKTFPKLTMASAAKMANEITLDRDIQCEIDEYLDGTEWKNIYVVPHVTKVDGKYLFGFMFAVETRK